jgi:hypothetical protein
MPHIIDGERWDTPWTVIEPWRPFAAAGRISDKLKSETAKQARALADELERRHRYVATVEGEGAEAEASIVAAVQSVRTTIERDAAEEGNGTAVARAKDQLEAARKALDPDTWRRRLDAARDRIEPAERELREYLDEHALELAFELQTHAQRVAHKATVAKIRELHERTVAPLEREHQEITDTLSTVLGRTEPIRATDIPSGEYDRLPCLSAEALERHRTLSEPAPEPSANEFAGG